MNRPLADLALRQLIIAKTVDNLSSSLGRSAIFPFLIQPRVASGSGDVDVPVGWIWDMSLSFPQKWERVRLAKIKRISGSNDGSAGYTGKLRLVFTATQQGGATETALVYVDYQIDSALTYQLARVSVVTAAEEDVPVDSGEIETLAGFVAFKTLDTTDVLVTSFLDVVAPPDDTSSTGGIFNEPAVYELVDSAPGDSSGTFSTTALSHGTGLLTDGAWNPIPALDSDVQSWVNAFNYPFESAANRTASDGSVIPLGLFKEFDLCVPAGDEPTGDVSGAFFPVWVSRVERLTATAGQLRFYFATYNVVGETGTEEIEFAALDLASDMTQNQVVEIAPISNLQAQAVTSPDLWQQGFGRGHVVLSSLWGGTTDAVADFFDLFTLISDDPADITFSKTSTRLSSFALSRVPEHAPTAGQAQAMVGSSARFSAPSAPSDTNRYVTEDDQGAGNQVDLEGQAGVTPHAAISRYGNSGALCHRIVRLIIDSTKVETGNNTFYETEVLPRLTILMGRAPQFGDMWYNGTRVFFHNGSVWQSLG